MAVVCLVAFSVYLGFWFGVFGLALAVIRLATLGGRFGWVAFRGDSVSLDSDGVCAGADSGVSVGFAGVFAGGQWATDATGAVDWGLWDQLCAGFSQRLLSGDLVARREGLQASNPPYSASVGLGSSSTVPSGWRR